jgi:CheY-like chemotaxis protein
MEAKSLASNCAQPWLNANVGCILALCQLAQGKTDEAFRTIAPYLQPHETNEISPSNRALLNAVAALTFAYRGYLTEAAQFRDSANELLVLHPNTHASPIAELATGHILHMCGQLEDATSHLLRVGTSNQSNELAFAPLRAVQELGEIYAKREDWRSAFEMYQRYHLLFEQAQKLSTRSRIRNLHTINAVREAETVKKHAEIAASARSLFLSNMSHEIRTPMNAIVGMAYLALRTDLAPKQRAYVEKISHASASLLSVISDALDSSKVDSGELHIETKELDVRQSLMCIKNGSKDFRVLVAEDNEFNQQVIVELLDAIQAKVDVVGTGLEAVNRVASTGLTNYDLILMDVQMPELDGISATRKIRQSGFLRPIFALTANASADDRAACLNSGMDEHFAKPIDPDALYAAIIKWCSKVEDGAANADFSTDGEQNSIGNDAKTHSVELLEPQHSTVWSLSKAQAKSAPVAIAIALRICGGGLRWT